MELLTCFFRWDLNFSHLYQKFVVFCISNSKRNTLNLHSKEKYSVINRLMNHNKALWVYCAILMCLHNTTDSIYYYIVCKYYLYWCMYCICIESNLKFTSHTNWLRAIITDWYIMIVYVHSTFSPLASFHYTLPYALPSLFSNSKY